LVGGYSRSLNSPPFFMILGSFKSIIIPFEGPNKDTGARVRILEIFHSLCFGILGNLSCDHPPNKAESPP
jgi:hypothetical protein